MATYEKRLIQKTESDLARILAHGIQPKRLVLEARSRNTAENAGAHTQARKTKARHEMDIGDKCVSHASSGA